MRVVPGRGVVETVELGKPRLQRDVSALRRERGVSLSLVRELVAEGVLPLHHGWTLRPLSEATRQAAQQAPAAFSSLQAAIARVAGGRAGEKGHEPRDYALFIDFLSQCLVWHDKERMTPAQGTRHGFMREQ